MVEHTRLGPNWIPLQTAVLYEVKYLTTLVLRLGASLEVDEEEAAGQPEGAVKEEQQQHLHTAEWVI